ncbi:polyprenyl synthetase family protein [Actinocatenispora rupis]|uniref:Dimethylallyltransferase n=1 Tax=Actinocatenispora rupis TaxID=519421 RepID=A0A8J3NDR7_9ACTN|nr:polyprenyl synthetase family protein [Actinocatenispora rupis]GID11804.1 dimethylallyltransferase [Actinocatenispora rupis]
MTVTLPESLESVRTLVEPALRDAVDRLDPRSRLVSGYHLGYWSADGTPTGGGGKGMRGAFALLSARAAGAPASRGTPAAVAIELVHNYSLLHDDVMDRDVERRHRRAAWTVYGEADAILAGDALLGLAFEVLGGSAEPTAPWVLRTVAVTVRRLVAGQNADLGFERRADVTLSECLDMVRAKTAALFACACSAGAMLCDAPSDLTLRLARYGEHLGIAFQLVDDLLGIWGTTEVTGKPVLHDLQSRKKSIPVVYALNSGVTAADRLRELYLTAGELDGERLALAAKLVEEAGGREWTEREAARRLDLALAQLDEIDALAARAPEDGVTRRALPADVRADLVDLAHFVTGRDR